MNFLWFFGVILIISYVDHGNSSFLTRGANNGSVDDSNYKNQTETNVEVLRAGNKLTVSLFVECACVKGEVTDTIDPYIVGEILFYNRTGGNKIVNRKPFEYGKKIPEKNNMNPVFKNFATISDENKYLQIGAYIELWDQDTLLGLTSLDDDDYLGSFQFQHESIQQTINTATKSKMFNAAGRKAMAVKCPKASLDNGVNCEGRIVSAYFYVTS